MKTATTRRSFFGFMAAAPVAVRNATQSVLDQAKMDPFGSAAPVVQESGMALLERSSGWFSKSAKEKQNLILTVIKKMGWSKDHLPPHKELQALSRAAEFQGMDPDLAALVSMAPGRKVAIQRRRNLQRARELMLKSLETRYSQQATEKHAIDKFGVELDWY